MMIARAVQAAARRAADRLGRESWVISRARPAYEAVLHWASFGRGIRWAINGVTYRIDPHHRHRLGESYDAPVATFLRDRVRPGATCIDVGANVGVYVLQFAHWSGPSGRVIAFEPNPVARAVLERHVALNGLTRRVEIVGAAVSAAPGDATLYAAGAEGMSRLGAPNEALGAPMHEITVPVVTLDAYCRTTGIVPDWLLVDVEGFEIAVLSGARQLIRERGTALGIVVEMHPNVWSSAGDSRATAEALLGELRLRPIALTGQRDPLGEHGLVCLEHA
ncbi:MAG: FkbM family methyltransferase [Gemmatimonadaceae bacterium]